MGVLHLIQNRKSPNDNLVYKLNFRFKNTEFKAVKYFKLNCFGLAQAKANTSTQILQQEGIFNLEQFKPNC